MKEIKNPIELWKELEASKTKIRQDGEINEEERENLLKEVDKLINRIYKAKVDWFLSRDYFIVSKKDVNAIIEMTFEYPDYNSEELRNLLSNILTQLTEKNPKMLDGKFEDDSWEFSFKLKFLTSPEQLKILFRDIYVDYPVIALDYVISLKVKQDDKLTVGMGAKREITLGQCVSLLKYCECKWQ